MLPLVAQNFFVMEFHREKSPDIDSSETHYERWKSTYVFQESI